MEYFSPYNGKKTYLFVSYAHKDSEQVIPTITKLRKQNLRIWYDEGIPAGSDWSNSIQTHLHDCTDVLFFASKNSFKSGNCTAEMRAAVQLNKRIWIFPLEKNIKPDGEWASFYEKGIILSSADELLTKAENLIGTEEDYKEKVQRNKGLNGWLVAAIIAGAFFIASIIGIIALNQGYLTSVSDLAATPVPTTEPTPAATVSVPNLLDRKVIFEDDLLEEAVREKLKTEEEIHLSDLYEIEELRLFGDYTLRDSDETAITQDGTCLLNTIPVNRGTVSSLSVLENMANLEKLVLINQPITSIYDLKDLKRLKELSIALTDVEKLEVDSGFENLEILDIRHTMVRDLEPLNTLKNLKTVIISYDMLSDLNGIGTSYELVLKK